VLVAHSLFVALLEGITLSYNANCADPFWVCGTSHVKHFLVCQIVPRVHDGSKDRNQTYG